MAVVTLGVHVPVAFGEFVFDHARRELRRGSLVLKVDAKLLDLLACFLAHPGRLISKQELLDEVWEGRVVADNVLSVSIAKLRKVLGHKSGDCEYIENRYGRGYRFLQPVVTVDEAVPRISAPPGLQLVEGAPLVGRGPSLRRLEAALARARAGNGAICVLVGEPGIGKTRLAEAFESTARSWGVSTAWGRCQATEGTPPLWPIAQVLRELSGDRSGNDVLRALREGAGNPSTRPETSESRPSIAEFDERCLYDGLSTSHRAVDEVTQALYRMSKLRPLAILLDDLQWADAASLRLLAYMVGEISRWPILIVATQRSIELTSDDRRERELRRLLCHRNCERIELGRLNEGDVAEYVQAIFGSAGGEVSRAVYARSEGNPFFMVELLRPWSGVELPTPERLQLSGLALDLVRQRLQGLPALSREVLAAAAVIGHEFDLGLLSYVTERNFDELLEALDGSLGNETVIPSAETTGAYAFDHELIREVLYGDLTGLERCRLHLRAGQGLQKRQGGGGEIPSAELAHHFLCALPQGDVSVAVAHARRAAAAATYLAAHADARNLLRRALDAFQFWSDPDPNARASVLVDLAIIERTLADPTYTGHLQQGVALAREHGFGDLLLKAAGFLSPGPGLLADPDACSVLDAAAEVLPEHAEKQRALVLLHQAWTPPNCMSAKRVRALLAEAEPLARRSGSETALAALRDAQLFFSGGPATLDKAEAIAAEIDQHLRDNPHRAPHWRAMTPALFRFVAAMQRGDGPAADRAIAEIEAVHARLNNSELAWHHERLLLLQRINRGDFAGAEAELERLRERAERMQLPWWQGICARDYAMLLLQTADASEFAARLRPSLALAPTDSPTVRARKIRSLAEHGFMDDARAALDTLSVEVLYDLPADRDYLATLVHLAVASAMTQSVGHCAALYELLRPYPHLYAIGISFHCDGSVSHFLGMLARALGRDDAALGHFKHALEQNQRFGLKGWAVQTGMELASLWLDSPQTGDAERGLSLLEQTQQAARRLGMYPLLQRAERRIKGTRGH